MDKFERAEVQWEIPKVFLKEFEKHPRIIIKHHPAGLWPIPIDFFRRADFLERILMDKEFSEKFQIVLMPK